MWERPWPLPQQPRSPGKRSAPGMGGTGSRVRFAYPGYMGAREALRGSPTVGGPAVHVRPVEAGRRLAAVRELVVVGVGGDGAVRVFVQQVVRAQGQRPAVAGLRSEEHTSELQSLMRISYAVFCLKKK